MNDKPWYEKIYIWIGIVGAISTILGVSVTDGMSLINSKDVNSTELNFENNTIGDQSPVFIGDGDNKVTYNYTLPEPTQSPESTTSSESEESSYFNFGQAIQQIYNNEKVIQNEVINNEGNKPINSSVYPGVSYWYIADKVRLIIVSNGFRDKECYRTYYFDENEKLTFALIKDDIGEHRLYFYDDILIRYVNEEDHNYDIDQDLNGNECEWTDLALEESYEIFNGVRKTSESDDFSVTASYDPNTVQSSFRGIDVLVNAKTSFPADYVTISATSDEIVVEPMDMHGGRYEWYFTANFYIKGTYIVTITACNSEGDSVSNSFEYIY